MQVSIPPSGVLCVRGWDCHGALERCGPLEATPGAPPSGPRSCCPHCPQMGSVCSHLCFSFKDVLLSIGFLACLIKSAVLANWAYSPTVRQLILSGRMGAPQFAEYPPPQPTSLTDIPARLLGAHRVCPQVHINQASLVRPLPGRQTDRQTHVSPKDYFLLSSFLCQQP